MFPRWLSFKFYSKCKLKDEKSPLAEHIYIRLKIILRHSSSSSNCAMAAYVVVTRYKSVDCCLLKCLIIVGGSNCHLKIIQSITISILVCRTIWLSTETEVVMQIIAACHDIHVKTFDTLFLLCLYFFINFYIFNTYKYIVFAFLDRLRLQYCMNLTF